MNTVHVAFASIACGSMIGSVVITILMLRRVADISENVSRIETWASEILRSVDPKNSLVYADHPSPDLPGCRAGSTPHLTIKVPPAPVAAYSPWTVKNGRRV